MKLHICFGAKDYRRDIELLDCIRASTYISSLLDTGSLGLEWRHHGVGDLGSLVGDIRRTRRDRPNGHHRVVYHFTRSLCLAVLCRAIALRKTGDTAMESKAGNGYSRPMGLVCL